MTEDKAAYKAGDRGEVRQADIEGDQNTSTQVGDMSHSMIGIGDEVKITQMMQGDGMQSLMMRLLWNVNGKVDDMRDELKEVKNLVTKINYNRNMIYGIVAYLFALSGGLAYVYFMVAQLGSTLV